jgi:hypothetical protein
MPEFSTKRTPETALEDQGAGQSVSPTLVPALVEAYKIWAHQVSQFLGVKYPLLVNLEVEAHFNSRNILLICLQGIKTDSEILNSGSPLVDFMAEYDRTKTSWFTLCDGFQYLKRDESVKSHIRFPTLLGATSWAIVYNILRANFDVNYQNGYIAAASREKGDGEAIYLSDVVATGIQDAGGDAVKVDYRTSEGSATSLEANLAIGADGASSFVRRLFPPQVERTYAGYAAWRATVPESLLSEATQTLFGNNIIAAFHQRDNHIIAYVPFTFHSGSRA